MGIPIVSNALKGWLKIYTVKVFTGQTVVNHIPTDGYSSTTMKLLVQPMPPEKVNRKPEEERSWKWFTIWMKKNYNLKIDDRVYIGSKWYKVQSNTDWNEAGFYECEAIEFFTDGN